MQSNFFFIRYIVGVVNLTHIIGLSHGTYYLLCFNYYSDWQQLPEYSLLYNDVNVVGGGRKRPN